MSSSRVRLERGWRGDGWVKTTLGYLGGYEFGELALCLE